MNKFIIGDIVTVDWPEYSVHIDEGVITGIERVPSNGERKATLARHLESLDTYEYTIASEYDGALIIDGILEKYLENAK